MATSRVGFGDGRGDRDGVRSESEGDFGWGSGCGEGRGRECGRGLDEEGRETPRGVRRGEQEEVEVP